MNEHNETNRHLHIVVKYVISAYKFHSYMTFIYEKHMARLDTNILTYFQPVNFHTYKKGFQKSTDLLCNNT